MDYEFIFQFWCKIFQNLGYIFIYRFIFVVLVKIMTVVNEEN